MIAVAITVSPSYGSTSHSSHPRPASPPAPDASAINPPPKGEAAPKVIRPRGDHAPGAIGPEGGWGVREGLVVVINFQPGMLMIAQASNGREPIERFREHKPDVTLMDLRLPDMSGIDA